MTTRDDYAARLRQLRQDAGMPSYQKLADGVPLSHAAIADILNGKRFPRSETHNTLAGLLCSLTQADRDDIDRMWHAAYKAEINRHAGSRSRRRQTVESIPTTLGYKIRFLLLAELHKAGLTQAWLAQRTGLSEKHVSQMLNARVPMSMEAADRLLGGLGREFTVGTAPAFDERTYENWSLT